MTLIYDNQFYLRTSEPPSSSRTSQQRCGAFPGSEDRCERKFLFSARADGSETAQISPATESSVLLSGSRWATNTGSEPGLRRSRRNLCLQLMGEFASKRTWNSGIGAFIYVSFGDPRTSEEDGDELPGACNVSSLIRKWGRAKESLVMRIVKCCSILRSDFSLVGWAESLNARGGSSVEISKIIFVKPIFDFPVSNVIVNGVYSRAR